MGTDPPVGTLDPEALQRFLDELAAAGFAPVDETRRRWRGPCPDTLNPEFTTATAMDVVLRDGWPYWPPAVKVEGIDSWHADHDNVCLWQEGDATLQWMTLQGIYDRIEEWAVGARDGFGSAGAALDGFVYFDEPAVATAAVDLQQLLGMAPTDGAVGAFSAVPVTPELFLLVPGWADKAHLTGKWFYRQSLAAPPATLEELRHLLTSRQRRFLDIHLKRLEDSRPDAWTLIGLVWSTEYGTDILPLRLDRDPSGRVAARPLRPTPLSQADRLRRAGPDADVLVDRRVAVFGVGALGSHVVRLLAASGVGYVRAIDGQTLMPVDLVRHAADPSGIGLSKAVAMSASLRHFDWCTVDPIGENPWHPDRIAELVRGVDLVIDATGLTPFATLLSRVAERADVPMVTVALYRAGSVGRVRRQARDDTPIVARGHDWRYPTIPPAPDGEAETIGLEVGCAAPINNAPPATVVATAARAVAVVIDALTGRRDYDDEVIDVHHPLHESPFRQVGFVELADAPRRVYLTDVAAETIRGAAAAAFPDEIGGVLVGVHLPDGPWITDAIVIEPDEPTPARYELAAGATRPAVNDARRTDGRVGYVGEWHSHPNGSAPSLTDRTTMAQIRRPETTGPNPVLIVARRTGDRYELDTRVAVARRLVPTPTASTGPLPASVEEARSA